MPDQLYVTAADKPFQAVDLYRPLDPGEKAEGGFGQLWPCMMPTWNAMSAGERHLYGILVMGSFASDDFKLTRTNEKLVEESEASLRTVQEAMSALTARGCVRNCGRSPKGTTYQLLVPNKVRGAMGAEIRTPSNGRGSESRTPRVQISAPRGAEIRTRTTNRELQSSSRELDKPLPPTTPPVVQRSAAPMEKVNQEKAQPKPQRAVQRPRGGVGGEQEEIRAMLAAAGVREPARTRLPKEHPRQLILDAIEARDIMNAKLAENEQFGGGWVVEALDNGFDEVEAVAKARERKSRAAEALKRSDAASAANRQRAATDRAYEQRYWSLTPEQWRAEIEACRATYLDPYIAALLAAATGPSAERKVSVVDALVIQRRKEQDGLLPVIRTPNPKGT